MAEKTESQRTRSDTMILSSGRSPEKASQAMIGPSIVIKGDLIGQEDILVQGRVEGTIDLSQHNLTVGENGVVKANVEAKSITVAGKMEGDLHGEELITIKKTGNFRGSANAPRVSLEDGAKFKGSIAMDAEGARRKNGASKSDAPAVARPNVPMPSAQPKKPN